jgi:2-keto-4-pentenoate hydratase/2-oxohepta-3-ene-1,7-dioic acid hydratase in catechol pathway
MRLVSFRRPDGAPTFGRVEGDTVLDLGDAAADLKSAIAQTRLGACSGRAAIPLAQVALLPVVPNPGKIFCVGHNYEAHREETGAARIDHPSIFTRWADTLVGHGDDIKLPKVSTKLDYEAELAVVIGRGGRYIAEQDADAHIAGYACFNDASVRDWQRHSAQFTPGKNFPATGGFGPWLVTPDEAGDLTDARVVSRLNGEVMQDQPVSDMIFSIARIIAYVSSFTSLSPGDVIATGTPGGVGWRRTPPVWMKPGDTIEVEIGKVGALINRIADA